MTKGPSLRHIHKTMGVPTARPFTLFHSARLTRTAESLRSPGAPAGRVLAQNEFPSKTMGVPTARPFTLFHSAHLTRTTESSGRGRPESPGCLLQMSSARKEGHLMWPSSCAGLFEILRKHPPCRGSRVPAYESDVLSNSLKSFGLPLPRLAFMHWPTKKPMTFWLPSRYCCA